MHSTSRSLRVLVSASAATRLHAAASFLLDTPAAHPALIVGSTRSAADDLARRVALDRGATFGLQRLSLTQLAARTAIVALAGDGRTPSTPLGAEAVAARAVFDATRDRTLRYFAPVADTPGFPRAVARTLQELRLTGLAAGDLTPLPLAGRDLADLLRRFEQCFESAGNVDRAQLLRTAARLLSSGAPVASRLVLLDLAVDHPAERELVAALVSRAASAIATVPHGERDVADWLVSRGGTIEEPDEAADASDLARLRRHLFTAGAPPQPTPGTETSLEFFSAPGEGRESVEIARRILHEARRGVRFDEMAIFVRSPHSYFGLLEHALRRAGVPAWFDRGTRRPHPTGRAFLALLACASERLSAARFAEYLSLGQVPALGGRDSGFGSRDSSGTARNPTWIASADEALARAPEDAPPGEHETIADETPAGEDDPIVAGTLRAPWQWEKFLVEAAVIGGDPARWSRRLDGKASELRLQITEAGRQDGADSGRVAALRQVQRQLQHLRAFALPIVERLAVWPAEGTWGEWLDRFEQLAPDVLRTPGHVLRVLADLRPMSDVGPIDLNEARRILGDRLLTLEAEPPLRRFGRVFVGMPQHARGRSFRVVFVPGLAERMFPQKPREDPLLLDHLRVDLKVGLDDGPKTQKHRLAAERLLLQLAAGAASERLYVSYPRIELSEARARVPSFYALDLMRAATGRVPDYEALEERARSAGNATLAWPAPPSAEDAIDDQEHDLAVLRQLLDNPDGDAVRGHANYLLKLNACLSRSVRDRWKRGQPRWSDSDGLVRVSRVDGGSREQDPPYGDALANQRLTTRAYSLSALQRFSACPYQFMLAAIYRLQPLEQPEPLQRLDPLARGSLFHEVQASFFRRLQAASALPVTAATVDPARRTLDEVIDAIAARAHDDLAPAVERVWADEIASIRRDLHAWLDHVARDGEEWQPAFFEFAFGRVPGERDAHSIEQDVALEGGFLLRGAIDLIEEHRQTKLLRVTDHKTGAKPERIEKVTIGGGAVLQPVLYAMAVEAALGRAVSHGGLFYCTSAGSFYRHDIPLNERTRAAGVEVLQVIDRALEQGFLAAAPSEEACGRCDFRPVCGADVYRRVSRKPQDRLADLLALRSRP